MCWVPLPLKDTSPKNTRLHKSHCKINYQIHSLISKLCQKAILGKKICVLLDEKSKVNSGHFNHIITVCPISIKHRPRRAFFQFSLSDPADWSENMKVLVMVIKMSFHICIFVITMYYTFAIFDDRIDIEMNFLKVKDQIVEFR